MTNSDGVLNIARELALATIEIYKMMIVTAIGGVVVVLPYVFVLEWVESMSNAAFGEVGATLILAAFMFLTIVPLAILVMFSISIIYELLPWDPIA